MYYIKADIGQKEGKIYGIASSAVEDRQGEIVSVDGWDLKNFKKAPRLLWAHDHHEPAIGKVTKTYYEGEGKNKKLMFEAVFQDVTEKARAVAQLVKEGFINTFSVGFKPLEMEGNVITKSELLEISVVNVPANPEAMMLAYKSLKGEGFKDEVIKEVGIEASEKDAEIASLKEQVVAAELIAKEAKDMAESAVKGLKLLNPQRSKQVTNERLSMLKVIARASDKLLEQGNSDTKQVAMHKVIKRSSEILIRSHKGDL